MGVLTPIIIPGGGGGGGGSGANLPVYNIEDYGAVIGSSGAIHTANLTALKAAAALAAANGGEVWIPPKTFEITRDASNLFCWSVLGNNITIRGVRGKSTLKMAAGQPNVGGIALVYLTDNVGVVIDGVVLDGNWNNGATSLTSGSAGADLPQATVNVTSTADFPSSGTVVVITSNGAQTVTYTGKTSTTFTGCSGGTGAMRLGGRVGRSDSIDGLNHTTQGDPKNHTLMLRGVVDFTITNCTFRQAYGDMIWVGASASTRYGGSRNVRVRDCDGYVAARSGIALAQKCDSVIVEGCRFNDVYAQSFDTEPVETWVRDVLVSHCFLDGWWNAANPARSANAPVSIAGGKDSLHSVQTNGRTFRMRDCTVIGSVIVKGISDVEIAGCTIICDHNGSTYAPLRIFEVTDSLRITNNRIFDRTSDNTGGIGHLAAIQVETYSDGTINGQPSGVLISGNQIRAQNGMAGIRVDGGGGSGYGTVAEQANSSGTSTAIDAATTVALASNGQNLATISTTIAAGSNGADLAVVTVINVASAASYPTSGKLHVPSTAGDQIITYTGKTATSFTGCTGGTGTLATGDTVTNHITLTVASTADFPSTGFLQIATTAAGIRVVKYESKTATTFVDCTRGAGTVATGGAVTMSKLTHTGAGWTVDQWAGWRVRVGTIVGDVVSNTSDTLVVYTAQTYDTVSGWYDPYTGDPAADPPTAGAGYVLYHERAFVDVADNQIDCSNEGYSNGAHGIDVRATRAGTRVTVRGNDIKNPNGDGVHVEFSDATRPFTHLAIVDNHTWDDQQTPTADACVGFAAGLYFNQLVLRNNTSGEGCTLGVTGLSAGRWLVNGGLPQHWAGYGAPESNVTAPAGSLYHRLDGGSGATFYVKETGAGNTGWSVLAGSAGSQLPAFAAQLACVGATLDPAIASSNIVFNSGQVSLTKVRVYSTSFSKIILQIGAAMVGGASPHVYVGVYKSDGTQTAAMATATFDALAAFGSSGVKTITLTNPVTVAAGDDVYIAILVTGGPSTPPSARANQAGPVNGDRTATQGFRAGGSGAGLTAMPASITLSGMASSGQMPFLGLQ